MVVGSRIAIKLAFDVGSGKLKTGMIVPWNGNDEKSSCKNAQ